MSACDDFFMQAAAELDQSEEPQVGQRWHALGSSGGVTIVGTCGNFPEYKPDERGMFLVESFYPPPGSVQPWRISERYFRVHYPFRAS